ncbi:MAG: hypothetical protein KatS3mg057_2067 [Herpetosiphonaceae bacterium]|nr:MAG: hypothetical protein KatS3mg057_2067 [Herpetosiphonaceae bacterium]
MEFRKQGTDLHNIKICAQERWNQRFLIETLFRFMDGFFIARNSIIVTLRVLRYISAIWQP